MRKALIILSPGFPENENDSTCIPPQQTFVRTLQQLYPGRQVIVLAFVYPFVSHSYEWHGVKVFSFGKQDAGRFYRKLVYARVWQCLQKLKQEYDVQGLLAFWLGPCAWLATRFGRRYRIPFYTWLLGQDARAGNKHVRQIQPTADSLIALSDFVADEFFRNYRVRPAQIVPPGIDPSLFDSRPVQKDLDLIGVGSLTELKQYDIFVAMILRLKLRRPGLRAMICGDGPERKELERRARENGLSETELTFSGRLPHAEILHNMQRARILVHPSAYEGFGVVCLEALYAGASVVSFVRPMNTLLDGWYPVTGMDEMEQVISSLLEAPRQPAITRMPFRLEESARAIHQFFDATSAADPSTGSYPPAASCGVSPAEGSRVVAIP